MEEDLHFFSLFYVQGYTRYSAAGTVYMYTITCNV